MNTKNNSEPKRQAWADRKRKTKQAPQIVDFQVGLMGSGLADEAKKRWDCHEELLEACKELKKVIDRFLEPEKFGLVYLALEKAIANAERE